MALHFFAPKTLGSFLIGAGSLVMGGVIYWYHRPTTWRGLLIKEGFVFLNGEDDYKGMFNDQKNSDDWKAESTLNGATEQNIKGKAESFCQKLDVKLPDSSAADYLKTKKNLIAFCTTDGIRTVKARLIQSKRTGWIEENNDAENKWKAIFAVYRYDPKFIDWLKENDKEGNKDLSQSSKVNEYTKLKTACTNLLGKNYREVSADHIRHGSWWCVELGYSTIKEKIQKVDVNWTVRSQDSGDWAQLKETWKETAQVKKWAAKANGVSEDAELTDESLKKLCGEKNINSNLSDEDSYREKYLVIKSVCRGGNIDQS